HFERTLELDARPLTGRGAHRETAAQGERTLLHADETERAVAAPLLGCEAAAVVGDLEAERRVLGDEGELNRVRAGVADGVRERFLRDTIDADLRVLAQPWNRRREHGDDVRTDCRHRLGERVQTLLETEIAEQHRAEVVRELTQ